MTQKVGYNRPIRHPQCAVTRAKICIGITRLVSELTPDFVRYSGAVVAPTHTGSITHGGAAGTSRTCRVSAPQAQAG